MGEEGAAGREAACADGHLDDALKALWPREGRGVAAEAGAAVAARAHRLHAVAALARVDDARAAHLAARQPILGNVREAARREARLAHRRARAAARGVQAPLVAGSTEALAARPQQAAPFEHPEEHAEGNEHRREQEQRGPRQWVGELLAELAKRDAAAARDRAELARPIALRSRHAVALA